MHSVFLVGNGFDMAAGLKTAPKLFLKHVLEISQSADAGPGAKGLAASIKKDVSAWSDYESQIGAHAAAFGEGQADEYLEQASDLCNLLGEWLLEKEELVSSEFVGSNAAGCMASMASFQRQLPELQYRMFEDVRRNRAHEDWHFDVACFNYTSLMRRMYESAGGRGAILRGLGSANCRLGNFIQVHGSLESDEIICGVDNAGQIANEAFASDCSVTKFLVKGETEREVNARERDHEGLDLIASADIICIYGMSFGASDARWWSAVRSRMVENQNTLLVLFSYKMATAPKTFSAYRRGKLVDEVIDSFLLASGGLEESDSIRGRIIATESGKVFPFNTQLEDRQDERASHEQLGQ
ncbi:AbiH family protein [Paratractidigestivibacter sp.]|uniref:AbiH family protein n=1 Tax=Paratractidigestivibacter sp. TaxID=2847316 RepID=UPI002ACB0DFB|nr:AbiH family protein [Paratractidigestivibacter sp.]